MHLVIIAHFWKKIGKMVVVKSSTRNGTVCYKHDSKVMLICFSSPKAQRYMVDKIIPVKILRESMLKMLDITRWSNITSSELFTHSFTT